MELIGKFVPIPGEDIVDIIPDEEKTEKPPYHVEEYELCDLQTPISGRIIDIFV